MTYRCFKANSSRQNFCAAVSTRSGFVPTDMENTSLWTGDLPSTLSRTLPDVVRLEIARQNGQACGFRMTGQ